MKMTTPSTRPAHDDADGRPSDAVSTLYAVELFVAVTIMNGVLIALTAPKLPDIATLYMTVI